MVKKKSKVNGNAVKESLSMCVFERDMRDGKEINEKSRMIKSQKPMASLKGYTIENSLLLL